MVILNYFWLFWLFHPKLILVILSFFGYFNLFHLSTILCYFWLLQIILI
jgi:hypothetical protein